LQIAALRPAPLKAIMPMCATDDRFANDAHYVGGLPGLTNLKWAAGFELAMSSPPDPAVVGSHWKDMWRQRLEATPSIAARWLQHQSNDAYWRHGSVGFAPEAIQCPVYLVDGWADSYAQSAERLLRSLNAPTQAIIGPWGHIYPDLAWPGPGLDWASQETRWWRHWLVDDADALGPKFRFYVNYATPSEMAMKDIPGRWASEKAWPSPDIVERVFHLATGRLIAARETSKGEVTSSEREGPQPLRYRRSGVVGLATPEWIPYAAAELPRDQRSDDARALMFDCPVVETTEVVGVPRLNVRLASDRPLAALAARLCEVDKGGRSWLVTYGILNLCFRSGFGAAPTPLEPDQFVEFTVELNPIAHRFKAGSILRLALSDTLWPLVWPSPEPATLTFDLEDCVLRLPVRPAPSAEVPFPIAIRDAGFSRGNPRLEIRESADGAVEVLGSWPDRPTVVAATNTEISGSGPDMELRYNPADPSSCRWRVSESSRYRRDDWDCETRVEIVMTSTRTHFRVEETLTALKSRKPFFSRHRRDEIERRFS
jgi:putative CocE/NonD family hydrolase